MKLFFATLFAANSLFAMSSITVGMPTLVKHKINSYINYVYTNPEQTVIDFNQAIVSGNASDVENISKHLTINNSDAFDQVIQVAINNYQNIPNYSIHVIRSLLNYAADKIGNTNINIPKSIVNDLADLRGTYSVYLPDHSIPDDIWQNINAEL